MKRLFLGVVLSFIMTVSSFGFESKWYDYGYHVQSIDNSYSMMQEIASSIEYMEGEHLRLAFLTIIVMMSDIKQTGKDFSEFLNTNEHYLRQTISHGYFLNLSKSMQKFEDLDVNNFKDIMAEYNKYSSGLDDEIISVGDLDIAYSAMLGASIASIIQEENHIYNNETLTNDTWEDNLVKLGERFLSSSQLKMVRTISNNVRDYNRMDSEINESKLRRNASTFHNSVNSI